MDVSRQLTQAAHPLVAGVTRAGGWALALATAGVAAARPARKPLHPRGQVWEGVLTRHGSGDQPTGVGWLDEPGRDDATVRISAAIGLPTALPDIHGLAIRLQQPEGEADILLATTGTAPGLRHVLRFTRSPTTNAHTTLLPYRSPVGPLLFAATPRGERRFDLAHAIGSGPWQVFAHLDLVRRVEAEISYDPLLNPPEGLENYPWVSRLRAPAYRTARRSRG
ncbi:hypothetical protein [Nocardioides gilvus]|uniref:hypothetical protein n=1 Tax=Nocardioides gilvus TaxID=1735589 RepID=UPI000D747FBD|nr:hypothetical protein [Nocardioides gilvus]